MTPCDLVLRNCSDLLRRIDPVCAIGTLRSVRGLLFESAGPRAALGDLCRVSAGHGGRKILAEVVGFSGGRTLLMPLEETDGIVPGAKVETVGGPLTVPVGEAMLGRVLGGTGEPIDGAGPIEARSRRAVTAQMLPPLSRPPITKPLAVGIKAVDAFMTLGRGQRVGIFGPGGTGKSSILGQIARNTHADVNVICLVGERGREVREFIEFCLGEEGMRRSVVVAVTADMPAALRIRGTQVAMTVAEHFRDRGLDVALMMDSVTRIAMAQREIGLAVGEVPAARGYTPSVFATLPKLFERSGTSESGSITGFFTVLTDEDDTADPVSEAVMALLDAHLILSRSLATAGRYPAIDVVRSQSRLMPRVVDAKHGSAATEARMLMSTYYQRKDLLDVGAYRSGQDKTLDRAIELVPAIEEFLRQDASDNAAMEETVSHLCRMVSTSTVEPTA